MLAGETPEPLRGAAARIVTNMEASLDVPTATSVRAVPAKLLEVNRQILNNHLARAHGGKVSFTHLIGFAVLRALRSVPSMNASFGLVEGKPSIVRHEHVNLGLAIDMQRPDGTRTLIVPNVKQADTLDFASFHAAYEDLIRRARANQLTPDDLSGTTVSITNPGTIGTMHSVPRLMPGQGVIVGVGAIIYPPEYESADPQTLAELGVGKVVTLTSTYDHRIIQGAESGEMLAAVHDLLVGSNGFYDDIFASLGVPYEPARWSQDHRPVPGSVEGLEKVIAVQQLVNMYRVRGHLIANLDPLGLKKPHTHPELDPIHWGLTIWDLDREFPTGGIAGQPIMKLRDILGVLRDAYARTIGVEYMHIQEPAQKTWIQDHVEGAHSDVDDDDKIEILTWLNAAEAFERFLHTKFLGQKRFSLEGAETLIPMLAFLLDAAAADGVQEVVMGMSHRGRLNVLANIVGKSYGQIFREFEGELDPNVPQGSGDVKYHVGATGVFKGRSGTPIHISLAANPSHLEAVDPVVEGMARAKQDRCADADHDQVLSVLIHGDAAFAGQGVVAETLNLSELPGYDVGGTVHIVVNNQVGFTTTPGFARSTVYATDIAKAVQAPIFHVNGDDPEASMRVVKLAFAFRQVFKKDVVVDMVCYRRYGHNEGDEPAFTLPRMYEVIGQRRSVRKLYTELLVNRGDLTLEDAEKALEDFRGRLDAAFDETRVSHTPQPSHSDLTESAPSTATPPVETGVAHDQLVSIVDALVTVPPGFTVHPKLQRIVGNRRKEFDENRIDWSLAEALAFGSLLLERHAGTARGPGHASRDLQPAPRRAGRSRHGAGVHTARAPRRRRRAVHGLRLRALGVRGGRVRVRLLGRRPRRARLLGGPVRRLRQRRADDHRPVRRRGRGQVGPAERPRTAPPARLRGPGSRALVGAARAVPRAVRGRQHARRVPHDRGAVLPRAAPPGARPRSQADGRDDAEALPAHAGDVLRRGRLRVGRFRLVLPDPAVPDPAKVTRLVFCSGKFAHELLARRDELDAPVAIVRIEQLYPWPDRDIATELARYPDAEVVWAQEEPGNMGARYFVRRRIEEMCEERVVGVVARPASPSPATGSSTVHDAQQQALLEEAVPS